MTATTLGEDKKKKLFFFCLYIFLLFPANGVQTQPIKPRFNDVDAMLRHPPPPPPPPHALYAQDAEHPAARCVNGWIDVEKAAQSIFTPQLRATITRLLVTSFTTNSSIIFKKKSRVFPSRSSLKLSENVCVRE